MPSVDAVNRCSGCPLVDQPTVPGSGPSNADRWLVGQCPGRNEVDAGRPFVGVAGRRLDKALERAGISRASLYVTNAVLCHPPENTSAAPPRAVEACHDRLIQEIRERKPVKLLALGGTAVLQCTGDRRPLGVLRLLPAVPSPFFDEPTVVRATYHPSPLALNVDPLRSRQFDEDVAWLPKGS